MCLTADPLPARTCNTRSLTLPLPAVELAIPAHLPVPGERTKQLKALEEKQGERSISFSFEAQGGTNYDLPLRLNRANITVEGGKIIGGDKLHLQFPDGEGYVSKTITFRW